MLTGVFLLGLSFLSAFAQDTLTLEQMQNNLNDGYYAVAAQVLGPQLIEKFQNDPEAHYLYAQALYLTQRFDEARTALDQSFELSDRVPADYQHLNGLLLAAEGVISEALSVLNEAFRDSNSYVIAMDWGRIAWQANRSEEALEAFNLASETEQGKKEIWPHINRGRILKALNDLDKAIDAFNRAIEVFDANDVSIGELPSPGYVDAFYQLGTLYEALGDIQEARANYQSALTVGSNYAPAAEALERLGN